MTSSLRRWQGRCIKKALAHFNTERHFFCQATPGAGKTRMAAELASRLLGQGKIDLVLCFAPSCQVVEGFRASFAAVLGRRFDGQLGAAGAAFTYQAMEYRDEAFSQLLTDYRGFPASSRAVLGRRFVGRRGAAGGAFAYQATGYRDEAFWHLLTDYRVFALFDEIHRCAGHDLSLSNSWGQQILQRIQDRATFTW